MADQRLTPGAEIAPNEAAVQRLKSRLRGELLRPGDSGYDEARRVWNGMIDRYPALISRSAGVEDVINCVNFVRENQLKVAVRGGGHNVTGYATCDGGLVLDLSSMKRAEVNKEAP